MSKNKLKMIIGLFLVIISVFFLAHFLNGPFPRQALSMAGLFQSDEMDHIVGQYTTIVDEQGKVLSMMARKVAVGDQLITDEGKNYRVEEVDGNQATAKFLGMDPEIISYGNFYTKQAIAAAGKPAGPPASIAMYHTHSDESYVPTDGADSIPFKGGIYHVGASMADELGAVRAKVNYDRTPHDPHDNNAYNRSRRTAVDLIKANPVAVFDVHRDGIPDPGYYRAHIGGKDVAKLRLVIGRENPRMSANMDFAKRMMAAANSAQPKVVKEIFIGKGNYNQDLLPTALLIEAGTHTNTREEAEKGIALFAGIVPSVLGMTGAPGAGRPEFNKPLTDVTARNAGVWKAVAWIVGVALVGGSAFLLVSAGSWSGAMKKLSGFWNELTGLAIKRRNRL
ncbi:MAG: stage II sporulation protein P [Peptococcaceae bacterium]|nr:MAG: stage II sporulation protein P [Peptococcaceae bacterium]